MPRPAIPSSTRSGPATTPHPPSLRASGSTRSPNAFLPWRHTNAGADQIALPRTATALCARLGIWCIRRWCAIGAGADPAVGKFDFDRHACGYGHSAMQWLAGGVADERETARQHAAIGERREQLPIAFATGQPRGDERTDGALGALRKHNDALALACDPRTIGLDIRGHAGAQPVRDAGIALAPPFDIGAQQLCAQAAADARKA